MSDTATREQPDLREELGLGDLVMAQVLFVVGSSWVGTAAILGRAHVAFWLGAMLLFYIPLAVVVIYLNRMMPLEGGLYQWTKSGLGEMAGFLTAWNLWVYAVIAISFILFAIPTELKYLLGSPGNWIPENKLATLALTGGAMAGITLVAIRGLDIGKKLHNVGSIVIIIVYVVLLGLPLWALLRGTITHYDLVPWQTPQPSWRSLAVFGQMTVGALGGFEFMAIMAGESRNARRNIGWSVAISAPIIALMFILGTSSVLTFLRPQHEDELIAPIPQAMRAALGDTSWVASLAISLLMIRAVASVSLMFTGLTRLPMTAGWDNLLPRWFAHLHPRRETPVNSILFVAVLVMLFIFFSMLGVRNKQEVNQLLTGTWISLYSIAYVALFALPLLGRRALRSDLPGWVKVLSLAGLISTVVSLVITVYPIIKVPDPGVYAAKVCTAVVVSNLLGIVIYKGGQRRSRQAATGASENLGAANTSE